MQKRTTCRLRLAAGRPWGRAGFTLLELLLVSALIVLLAAILLPVLAVARQQSRRTACLSNVRQLLQAHLLYLQDYDEQLPYCWQGGPPRPQPFGPYVYWTERLQPYLGGDAVFWDPGGAGWQPRPPEVKLADYALLTFGIGGTGTARDPYWAWPGPPLSLAQVKRPSEAIQLTDGYTTTSMTGGMVAEHGGGVNMGFLDGHAAWMTRRRAYVVAQDEEGHFFYRYVSANR
jgi:prepilin-type processing-associated H-X9-DG protein/prepilin-type N-terminal cleavage/methylation domain-containing protein